MAKYKIIKEFVLNGVPQKLDTIVELDHKMANLRSIQENIEKVVPVVAPVVPVEAPKAPVTDPTPNIPDSNIPTV